MREPGFRKMAAQERTPFWHDMKRTAASKNFVMLTLTVFTLAMGFNFVALLGSYIPVFYIFGGDKVAGATLLGITGTLWAVTGVLAVFPLNWISPRLGKRNTLALAILLMILAQVSKIACYHPAYPYLIMIPTVLLSTGMLFFFTLGSSMVGDICDEDELMTGHRCAGSFYAVFWWFIKMGTALASLVAGALIVLTLFDETQVMKVDALNADIRQMQAQIRSGKTAERPAAQGSGRLENTGQQVSEALADRLEKARRSSSELLSHLKAKSRETKNSAQHFVKMIQISSDVDRRLANLDTAMSLDLLERELSAIATDIAQLTQQSPHTLLMMRVVEIGVPLCLSVFSVFFILRYSLTEKRSQEIKVLLSLSAYSPVGSSASNAS